MVRSNHQYDKSVTYRFENYALRAAKEQLENCVMDLQKITKN